MSGRDNNLAGVNLHDLHGSTYVGSMKCERLSKPSRWNVYFKDQILSGKPGEPNLELIAAMKARKIAGLGPFDRAIVVGGKVEWDEGYSEARRS